MPGGLKMMLTPGTRLSLIALATFAITGPMAAQNAPPLEEVKGLPLVEMRAKTHSDILVIFLSGDGGWADIDKQIGKTLVERGVDVIGFDDRQYLMTGHRDPDGTAADVTRVARRFMRLWENKKLVIVGYSRGAAFAPFIMTRLPEDVRQNVALVAMLGLPEHASFKYHFSDLWSTTTSPNDAPILPELQKSRGANMMCVYGTKEDESLCRSIDSTLVAPFPREGGHHFDGDYRAITDQILSRIGKGQ